MDALALLCTLHADGPATLKRLRARGYSDLVTLIQRSSADLSADLGVEPAYGRRLLREAKLLAVRVGAEGLEAEEAPPVATTAPLGESGVAEPMPPTISIERAHAGEMGSTLDASDRSLVDRIVGQQPAAELAEIPAAEIPNAETPGTAFQEPVRQPVHVPMPAPEPAPEVAEEPGLFTAGTLPGLDAELVADLHASGIRSLSDLASAESLALTRSLGITFAQARRLGFLARRAAAAVEAPSGSAAPAPISAAPTRARQVQPEAQAPRPVVARESYQEPTPPVAPVPVQPRVEVPAPVVDQAPAPAATPVAANAPVTNAAPTAAVPASEAPTPAAPPEPVQEVATPEEPAARRPFWEPRKFLTDSAARESAPDQGVKVDPSEIAPRPRFGDRLAQAAARNRAAESRVSEAQAAPSTRAPGSGQTVLGWNFEIPRPVDEPALPLGSVAVPKDEAEGRADYAPEYSAGVSVPRPEVPRQAPRDQDHGGPFA